MLRNRRNFILDIYDYSKNKLCQLYDNQSDVPGQARDVIKVTERNGWKQLSFTIPSMCEDPNGQQVPNFRLDFLKADYLIRLKDDEGIDWFIISEPKIVHNNFSKNVSVTADHTARLLKTKNLGLEFSDKEGNNVGTAEQLLSTILEGTGWEVGDVADFKEKRGGATKVRSMKASSKTGAFKLISSMCDLFEAKPIYHYVYDQEGKEHKVVDIVPMNPFSEPENGGLPDVADNKQLELHYGKNLKNVTRTLNTENLVTKLFCYGAYGDKVSGYCGVDEWKHYELKFMINNLVIGQEYYFEVIDPHEPEQNQQNQNYVPLKYKRYFKANAGAASSTLVWSLLDPASMSYIWNETSNVAYKLYDTAKTNSALEITLSSTAEVTNQFSFLMDFDYYDAIGLLTDDMLQMIAKYQRNMPQLLIDTNVAATAFNTSLDKLAETIGQVNFCRLSIQDYDTEGAYVKMNLNVLTGNDPEEGYKKGVMYRTDYTVREKDQFLWRVAKTLKDNGDPLTGAPGIIYIIHTHTDPVTYDLAYLKEINGTNEPDDDDLADPTSLTIWRKQDGFDDEHLQTDKIYLFQANTINGLLGACQAADEKLIETLDSQTINETVKHPVYFMKPGTMREDFPNTSLFKGYAWLWGEYSSLSDNDLMYFCYKNEGDEIWRRVYFCEDEDSLPSVGVQTSDYCYMWRKSMVCRYNGTTWDNLDESTKEKRVVALFGTVWTECQRRDKIYSGTYDYYTLTITSSIINQFGDGTSLPVGNYAIKDLAGKYSTYHAFTTASVLTEGQKLVYDTTNRWFVVFSANETRPYSSIPLDEYVNDTLKCRDFRFDNTFSNKVNVLSDATWTSGDLSSDGGEEEDETMQRTGFLGVYPNVTYADTNLYDSENGIAAVIHFYTMNHIHLGAYTHTISSLSDLFTTPEGARFIRIAASADITTDSATCGAKNAASSFVTNEEMYYNIGVAEPQQDDSNSLKGIDPLMKIFADISDQAYLTDYKAMKDAQEDQSDLENEMISKLGDVYREGYWQKADYVDGDEEKLYYDGLENLKKIAKPETKYDIQYLDLYGANTEDFNYSADEDVNLVYWPDIQTDFGVHIVDPEIGVSQWGFIDKLSKCYDHPWKTAITVNTNMSTIGQHSFTDVMSHIADVAKEVNGKMEIYDRADVLDQQGRLSGSQLQGRIDANTLLITGGSSTWYTDNKGNIVFEASDGNSAMMMSGMGWLIADDKNEWGEWNWRTSATGKGIVADMITAGTVDADRIISDKLMQRLGSTLEISGDRVVISGGEYLSEAIIDINNKATQASTAVNNAVSSIVVEYKLSDSPTDPNVGSYADWSTQAPAWSGDAYMWQRTTTNFVDPNKSPVQTQTNISGQRGSQGRSLSSVDNYYKANTSMSIPPPLPGQTGYEAWSSTVAQSGFGVNKPYLWNYEVMQYSDGNQSPPTTPAIICIYSETGTPGGPGRGITDVTEYYMLTTTNVAPQTPTGQDPTSAGWSTQSQSVSFTYKYLWNTEQIEYDAEPYYAYTTPRLIDQYSKTISSISVSYSQQEDLDVVPSELNWQNQLPIVDDGNYLWTRIITDYADNNETDTIEYRYTKQGQQGEQGSSGNSVQVFQIAYQYGDDSTDPPEGDWYPDPPESEEGMYLWTRTILLDGNIQKPLYSIAYNAINGRNGANGRQIGNVVNYYCATSSTSEPASSSYETNSVPSNYGENNPYLWNYEVVYDTANEQISRTTPQIIAVYGRNGQNGQPGQNGQNGIGISSIEEWYARTDSTDPPEANPHDQGQQTWSDDTIPTLTVRYRYLWNVEIINYTFGNPFISQKRIIGIYGDTGEQGDPGENGVSIVSMTTQYAKQQQKVEPPEQDSEDWKDQQPTWEYGYYIWIRTKVIYSDSDEPQYIGVSCDTAWEAINDIEVGGKNLLEGTTNQPIDIEVVDGEKSIVEFGPVDIQNMGYKEQDVTFSVYMIPEDETEWQIKLYSYANEASSPTVVSNIISEEGRYSLVMHVDDISSAPYVKVAIKQVGIESEGQYSCPMLEFGNRPSAWQAALQDDIQSLQLQITSSAKNVLDSIAGMYVESQLYTEQFGDIGKRLAAVEASDQEVVLIAQQTSRLLGNYETRIIVGQDGLKLRQSENADYEALLTQQGLKFVDSNDNQKAIAYFDAIEGSYASRLWADEKLSIGTSTYGYYDFVMLNKGLGEKWRNGTATSVMPNITKHPDSVSVQHHNDTITFSADCDDSSAQYVWQRNLAYPLNIWQNAGSGQTYMVEANEDNVAYAFRCVASKNNNEVATNVAFIRCENAPIVIYTQPSKTFEQSEEIISVVAKTIAINATEYQWQEFNDQQSSWQDISNGTNNEITVSIDNNNSMKILRCKLTRVVNNNRYVSYSDAIEYAKE